MAPAIHGYPDLGRRRGGVNNVCDVGKPKRESVLPR